MGFPIPGRLKSMCRDEQRVFLANVVERLENGFFVFSQLFHPMFKIYKYIAVESHVWSERHMCHIFSFYDCFQDPLQGPPGIRLCVLSLEQWVRADVATPYAEGQSCPENALSSWAQVFCSAAALQTQIWKWFIIPWLLLEAEGRGEDESRLHGRSKLLPSLSLLVK